MLGTSEAAISAGEDFLSLNGRRVKVFKERDPARINWTSLGIEIVVESTGLFTKKEDAQKHLQGSVRKVVISAPAKNEDVTLVMGVNEEKYDRLRHHVISNASCTTNCLAPVAKVLHQRFGIASGSMTTVHSYTNDQRILDFPHSGLRRARAAAVSMIPTTTGAAKAVALVLPELKGKLDGIAIRVPTPNVSLVDFVATLERPATAEVVNAALTEAAEGSMKGILKVSNASLVSVDFKGDPHSSIVDAPFTRMIGDRMVKVLSWYDNEWGYSCRVRDLVRFVMQA